MPPSPVRAHQNIAVSEHGRALDRAIGDAAHRASVDAYEHEVYKAALEYLSRYIEDHGLDMGRYEVETAVFGEQFRVQKVADNYEGKLGETVVEHMLDTYVIRYGWLVRDEVFGALCRWCAGTGLNPDLSRTKQQLLALWQPEPAPYPMGEVTARVVRGVCFDHPFAAFMECGEAARAILEQHCIDTEEARCPRCLGWGDERAT